MLRFIENPTWDGVLSSGDCVRFKVEGELAILVRTPGDSMYVCMDDHLSGSRPSYEVREELVNLTGWHSVCGWQLPGSYVDKSIEDCIDWFCEDCGDVDYDITDFMFDCASDVMVSSTVERKEFVLKDYTDTLYTGLNGYHHSHSVTMNTPKKEMKEGAYRIGVELEIEAKSRSNRQKINKVRSNWFFQETDSSLASDRGIELVTIPLLPKDAMSVDTWSPLVEYLKPIAESYSSSRCGLHVHIGREALGKDEEDRQATLGKLLFFYYEYLKPLEWNTKIFGRRHTYSENEFRCKESEAVKVLGMDLMSDKKIRDKVDKGLKATAGQTRYYDINVQNAHTIEFRKGKGSICTERIIAIITYCDLMIRYCRKRDWMGMSAEDFLGYIRKTAAKSSPIFRYLPTMGEEE